MSHALKKADRIYIPPRDKALTAHAKPVKSVEWDVESAFGKGMNRYYEAMRLLSRV